MNAKESLMTVAACQNVTLLYEKYGVKVALHPG